MCLISVLMSCRAKCARMFLPVISPLRSRSPVTTRISTAFARVRNGMASAMARAAGRLPSQHTSTRSSVRPRDWITGTIMTGRPDPNSAPSMSSSSDAPCSRRACPTIARSKRRAMRPNRSGAPAALASTRRVSKEMPAVRAELLEVSPEVGLLLGVLDAREGHAGAGDLLHRSVDEILELRLVPGDVQTLDGIRIIEALEGCALAAINAVERRAELDRCA